MKIQLSILLLLILGSLQNSQANQQDTTENKVFAQSAAQQQQTLEKAEQGLSDGNIEKAIEAYASLVALNPENDRLRYNHAVALHTAGKSEEAEAAFEQLSTSLDSEIAAKARYNIGNCKFSKAMEVMMEQPPQAVELLQECIQSFRSSLKLNPNDKDARSNIELAVQWLKKLQQLKDQQQDQSSDQSQEQEDQSQQEQSEDQQQDQGGQEQNKQQGDEQQENENQQQDQSQQDQKQQGSNESQNESPEDRQSDSSGEGNTDQQDNNSESQSKRQDQSADQQQDQQQSDSQSEDTSNAGKENQPDGSQPKGELSADNKQQEGTPQQLPVAEGKMTKQEALKMLQSIRDRDFLRRLRIEAAEKARRLPVEKDW